MHLLSGFLASAFVLTLGLPGSIFASNPNIIISYNQQRDKISIQTQDASLTTVLSEVAKKTNITIRIDPAVEKTVNFQLPPQPLQQALQKIVKGLSYVIEYSTNENQQAVVSGMRLLPKGKQDSGQLVPVSVLNARARQYNGEGDSTYKGSLNRRGNYYPGSRQPRANHQPRPSSSSRQRDTVTDDMATRDIDQNTSSQNRGETTKEEINNTKQGVRTSSKKSKKQPCTDPYCR